MAQINGFQLAKLLANIPVYAAPTILQPVYVVPEIQVGDSLESFPMTATGFPIPTGALTMTLGGITQSNGYTTVIGDVGKAVLASQTLTNAVGSVTSNSTPTSVIAVQTAYNNGLLGSNTTDPFSYTPGYFINNAAQGGTIPTDLSSNVIPAANIGATGWPTVAFQFFVTKPLSGASNDGQLAAGTYNCSYRLLSANAGWTPGTVPTVSALAGCTVSGLTLQPDNITIKFTMVTTANQNVQIKFTGGVAYVDIPRDGVTPTWNGPEFAQDMLASMSQHDSIRMMDLNNSIPPNINATSLLVGQDAVIYSQGTTDYTLWGAADNRQGTVFTATGVPTGTGVVQHHDITWANRIVDYGTTGPGWPYAIERQIRFINSVANYPSSKIVSMWFNLNPYVTDNYAFNAAGKLTSILTTGVPLYIEIGNEPWNTGSTIYPIYSAMAQQELQCLCSNKGSSFVQLVSSITGNGTTTTVTLTSMPSFITNGAQFFVNNPITAAWSKDAGGVAYSISHLATVLSVVGNTFTYASQGNGTMSLTDTWQAYFNPSSTLIGDGITDINQLPYKWYVRRAYQIWTQFQTAGRTQDRFVLNLQTSGTVNETSAQFEPVHYAYATYIANATVPGTNINTWLYATAVAPYVKAQSRYSSASTGAPNQILGVPWASTAVVGDSINVSGVGASGATLATAVAAGSSGTTLNIAGTVLTNVTATATTTTAPPSIVFTDGDSTSILNCMISGFLPWIEVAIRNHAYFTRKYGVRMMAYEISIDIQSIPNQQISISSNSLLSTVIQKLLELWYGCGGQEAYCFSVVPGVITNVAQGSWNWMSSWTDTTSPKVAALLAYRSEQRFYQNLFSPSAGAPPTVYGVKLSGVGNVNADQSVMAGTDANGTSITYNTTNGMCYWVDNTGARNANWAVVFNRSRRYSATLSGSDSTAGTVAMVYLDNVQIGTATLPANGAGSAGATVASSVTMFNMNGLPTFDMPSGTHNLAVKFTSSTPNKGTVPGIASIAFTAL